LVFLQSSPGIQHIANSKNWVGWVIWEFSVKTCIISCLLDYPANSSASTENAFSQWCWEGTYPHSQHVICIL
jgi:hypothetical protein